MERVRLPMCDVIITTPKQLQRYGCRRHRANELIAFRTGSYAVKLCKSHAEGHFGERYPGGKWWTLAGPCQVCGITVYLNPGMTLHYARNKQRDGSSLPMICSPACSKQARRFNDIAAQE